MLQICKKLCTLQYIKFTLLCLFQKQIKLSTALEEIYSSNAIIYRKENIFSIKKEKKSNVLRDQTNRRVRRKCHNFLNMKCG